jgi:ABC-2 type transport system permease protein
VVYVLEVTDLTKRYGDVLALDRCRLGVPAGHLVGLLGPNGAGSLGSLASRTEDAQAAAGPVIALLVAIYIAAVAAMSNPGAGWVTLLSLLPPTAPMLMPLRASLVNVPAWQVIIAVIFALAAIYGLFRIGARLYRNAILHTGARLHLREAWRGEQVPQQP